jgi:starch synthase
MKYGTIPVVRATGGLDDTLKDFDPESGVGNGFKFEPYTVEALVSAVQRS